MIKRNQLNPKILSKDDLYKCHVEYEIGIRKEFIKDYLKKINLDKKYSNKQITQMASLMYDEFIKDDGIMEIFCEWEMNWMEGQTERRRYDRQE